jgi:hypothetical protein
MAPLAMLSRVLYETIPRPRCLAHRPTRTLAFVNRRLGIFDDSPAATCTIRTHRLIWFAWNRVLLVDIRWL